ncbi:hypothetical protein BSZ39_06735 [Bowdeniella nasicola]|uniref:Glutaredoxin-like domain n=1 Tax=Bowdeniella nasicola TaxID=208480 RepID=A0A1Q5Q258_9ACTO|nr:glutaredoxin family protein [Bowdeniella nasicola]OKL53938.1 hypothetical protein BSZ39_06735 [Bowdeniella nasicola]
MTRFLPRRFRRPDPGPWPAVTVYTRAGCHLCDDAIATVKAVLATREQHPILIDIDADAELRERFTDRVPVIAVGERIIAEYTITERALRTALETGR